MCPISLECNLLIIRILKATNLEKCKEAKGKKIFANKIVKSAENLRERDILSHYETPGHDLALVPYCHTLNPVQDMI